MGDCLLWQPSAISHCILLYYNVSYLVNKLSLCFSYVSVFYSFSHLELWAKPVPSPAVGHWDTCLPRLPTISFLVPFGVNLTAN